MNAHERLPGMERSLPQPGELWSLWDMIELAGKDFCDHLGRVRVFEAKLSEFVGAFEVRSHESTTFHLEGWYMDEVSAFIRDCEALGLFMTVGPLKEFERNVRGSDGAFFNDEEGVIQMGYGPAKWFGEMLSDGIRRFEDETKGITFLVVDPARREMYRSNAPLFGDEVAAAFPSSVPELRDAGKCLALGQPTAAVFHILRAMEAPLKALAAEFGIKKFTDWNSALEEVEDAVRNRTNPAVRPNWANEKDYFTDMIPFLYTVKNAWRNYTMHLKLRHTEDEAAEIMGAAKSFMQRAAKRLHEYSDIA